MYGDLKHYCYNATFFFVEVCKHTSGQVLKYSMEQLTKKILQIFSFVHSHSFAFAECVSIRQQNHMFLPQLVLIYRKEVVEFRMVVNRCD